MRVEEEKRGTRTGKDVWRAVYGSLARVLGLLLVVHGNSIPREVFLDLGLFAFLNDISFVLFTD